MRFPFLLARPGGGGSSSINVPKPILIEGFNSATGFSSTNTAALQFAIDTATGKRIEGTGSLKLIAQGIAGGGAYITKSGLLVGVSGAELGVVAFLIDNGQDAFRINHSRISVRLGQGAAYPSLTDVNDVGFGGTNNDFLGKRWYAFDVATELAQLASFTNAGMNLRVLPTMTTPFASISNLDCLMYNAKGPPTLCLTFDDLDASQVPYGYQVMKAAGLRGTIYVPVNYIDVAGRWTMAQLKQAHDDGWAIGPNGTRGDTPMTSAANIATVVGDLQADRDLLWANGIRKGTEHIALPNGFFRTQVGDASYVAPVTLAAVTSNGTAVVTTADTSTIASAANWDAHSALAPSGTKVVSIDSGTQVTLSANVPAGTVPMSFTDTRMAFYNGKLQAALRAAGFKTARLATPTTGDNYTYYGLFDMDMALFARSSSTQSAAQMAADLVKMKARGSTQLRYFHRLLVGASGIDTERDQFATYINNSVAPEVAAGMYCLPVDEMYERDWNGQKRLPF